MASPYIALYLFFAGAGGGAFVFAFAVDFMLHFSNNERLCCVSKITDPGLCVGPVLVALSTVFLLVDLGVPYKAASLFYSFSPSIISVGAWFLLLFCVLSTVSFALGFFEENKVVAVFEIASNVLAAICAVAIMVYAGIFLSAYPSVPFLHTPLVPGIFFVSALATGLAVLLFIGYFRLTNEDLLVAACGLLRIDIALVALEASLLIALIAISLAGLPERAVSAQALLSGDWAALFWIGVVGAGVVIPFSADILYFRKKVSLIVAIGSLSVLAGGVCLRFALLLAAQRYNLATMDVLSFWLW